MYKLILLLTIGIMKKSTQTGLDWSVESPFYMLHWFIPFISWCFIRFIAVTSLMEEENTARSTWFTNFVSVQFPGLQPCLYSRLPSRSDQQEQEFHPLKQCFIVSAAWHIKPSGTWIARWHPKDISIPTKCWCRCMH